MLADQIRLLRERARWLVPGVVLVGCCYACQTPTRRLPDKAEELTQLWRLALPDTPDGRCALTYPLIRSGKALLAIARQAQPTQYVAVDLRSGKLQWTWTDTSGAIPYYNWDGVASGNRWIAPDSKTLRVFDLRSGRLVRQITPPGSPSSHLTPSADGRILQASNDWEGRKSYICLHTPHSGDSRIIHSWDWPDSCLVLIQTPVPFAEDQVCFGAITQNTYTRQTTAEWRVMDMRSGEIVRSSSAYPPNSHGRGPTHLPLVYQGDLIAVVFDHIVRLDPTTLKERWKLAMPRDMLTSKPQTLDSLLFCAMEDGLLYAINLESGQISWRAKFSGTPSRLVVCDSLLYAVGGGDGFLYTFDTRSGQLIRKMKSPNYDYREDEFFMRFIGADCESGVLLLFDGRSIRAYSLFEPD